VDKRWVIDKVTPTILQKNMIKPTILAAFLPLLCASSIAQTVTGNDTPAGGTQSAASLVIPLPPGEKIWSGVIKDGENLPYIVGAHFDFYANNRENQIQPLLLGNQGWWVWSEEPFAFEICADKIIITNSKGEVKHGRAGNSLAEARKFASAEFFPPSGRMPDELLFAKPQYNTWIELTYNQNQQDVLKYARAIVANGFPPGVLMIDDTWQEDYGVWKFHPGKFPDPKRMMDELHRMGFKVMLWMCPFVSADQSRLVHDLLKDKCFLMQKTGAHTTWETATAPAIIKWWNGYSALLDFSNPMAIRWYNEQMDRLVRDYGVDGFKLDAGDMHFYPPDALSKEPVSPNRQCELYAQFGLRFPLNEYRACWKMAGQPLAQRLHDKNHNWEDVRKLIPQMLAEGLAGYTFSCPDMIGGGDYGSFLDLKKVDQDLVVRSAQIHALMPMMQFSLAPWRVLDATHLNAVKKAVAIRMTYAPEILELARNSAKTGDPIVRSLEYVFPNQGYEGIKDEFMLGDTILVAPLDKKGTSRQLVLPKGTWVSDDGKTLTGGAAYTLDVPLDRIPCFRLKS
jgi:alpha-glucosidase